MSAKTDITGGEQEKAAKTKDLLSATSAQDKISATTTQKKYSAPLLEKISSARIFNMQNLALALRKRLEPKQYPETMLLLT